jgi:hypothetical protein
MIECLPAMVGACTQRGNFYFCAEQAHEADAPLLSGGASQAAIRGEPIARGLRRD